MYQNLIIAQVLLTLVVGLWLAAKYRDSPIIRFFGRNDWFVGVFLILVGYMNFIVYNATYLRNLNLILIVVGLILVLFTVVDASKK